MEFKIIIKTKDFSRSANFDFQSVFMALTSSSVKSQSEIVWLINICKMKKWLFLTFNLKNILSSRQKMDFIYLFYYYCTFSHFSFIQFSPLVTLICWLCSVLVWCPPSVLTSHVIIEHVMLCLLTNSWLLLFFCWTTQQISCMWKEFNRPGSCQRNVEKSISFLFQRQSPSFYKWKVSRDGSHIMTLAWVKSGQHFSEILHVSHAHVRVCSTASSLPHKGSTSVSRFTVSGT